VKCQKELIKNNQYFYLLAEEKNESTGETILIGMLALKKVSHIFHFFISTNRQKQGVGTKLWKHYLQAIKTDSLINSSLDKITVNASDFGTAFYLKLGFKVAEPRTMKNGVYYTPLLYSL